MPKLYTGEEIELPDYILEKVKSGIIYEENDKGLRWRYRQVKPIITTSKFDSYLIKGLQLEDLRTVYLSVMIDDWGFSDVEYQSFDLKELVQRKKVVQEFYGLTKYNSRDHFCISLESVLMQIPKEALSESDAVEVVEFPDVSSDLSRYPEITNKGYHLYRAKTYRLPIHY